MIAVMPDVTVINPLPHPWAIALTGWVGHLRMRGLSPKTIRLRRAHMAMIARRTGADSPAGLTREQLLALVGIADWSTEYRKSVRSSVTGFYGWLIDNGHADDDVSDCLPPVMAPQPRPRPCPDHVWESLIASAPPRERLMARLAGWAGLRRAEVAGLHRDDVIADRDGWSLRITGKGGKQRVVPITDDLARELLDYQPEHGFVFPGREDGHLSEHHVGKLLSALMPPSWTMHTLRHRYAPRGHRGTGNLRAVQEALGHSSVATTERYTAVARHEVRAVSEAAR